VADFHLDTDALIALAAPASSLFQITDRPRNDGPIEMRQSDR